MPAYTDLSIIPWLQQSPFTQYTVQASYSHGGSTREGPHDLLNGTKIRWTALGHRMSAPDFKLRINHSISPHRGRALTLRRVTTRISEQTVQTAESTFLKQS